MFLYIFRIFKRFREMSPQSIPKCMTNDEASRLKLLKEDIQKLPELIENPFKGD